MGHSWDVSRQFIHFKLRIHRRRAPARTATGLVSRRVSFDQIDVKRPAIKSFGFSGIPGAAAVGTSSAREVDESYATRCLLAQMGLL